MLSLKIPLHSLVIVKSVLTSISCRISHVQLSSPVPYTAHPASHIDDRKRPARGECVGEAQDLPACLWTCSSAWQRRRRGFEGGKDARLLGHKRKAFKQGMGCGQGTQGPD